MWRGRDAAAPAHAGARLWRTTTFRLTILFGAVFAVALLLLLGLVYLQTASYLTARVDRALAREVAIFRAAEPGSVLRRLRQESARDPLNTFGLFSPAGDQLAGDTRLRPSDLSKVDSPEAIAGGGRTPPGRAEMDRLPWGETLVVERDTSQLVELRQIILSALLWSGAAIAVLGLGCAVALSIHPLRRVQAFRRTMELITAGEVSRRLPVGRRRDELDELALLVNAMMDELERLVEQARSVGEGVAHELRTPLTRLRARLDHAREAFHGTDAVREDLLERCVQETEGVLARFNALLRIAAVEARSRSAAMTVVRLEAIVAAVAEMHAPVAAERGVDLQVRIPHDVRMRGDADLLTEAVSNLVDNALKFTPPGGRVALALTRSARGVTISVTDDGPGIAPEERARVTRRFYRGPQQAEVPGHGLGLSLVAAVAELHDLDLAFADAGPGVAVTLASRS